MPSDILRNKKLSIGFDPRLFTKKTLNIFFGKSNCNFKPLDFNLVDKTWKREIEKSQNNFYLLPKYSGNDNYKLKIKKFYQI